MSKIRDVELEFLRPGPANNQLLSPLTPYIALCNGEGPTTIFMPFEHHQLLNRLERLRYMTQGKEISHRQSVSEAHDLGGILGQILGQIPALISSLSSSHCEKSQLIHLRLSTKAYEIALLPFELSIATDGFPSAGSPLFLQSNEPITITREARGRHPIPMNWDRPPRILFAFAAPGKLPAVPYREHLKALRRAIEPWVKYQAKPEKRIEEVKQLLTVLPNASLQDIRNACAKTQYTYIHILAHGDSFDHKGHTNYGLALCSELDSNKINVIDGATLAYALTAKDSLNEAKVRPTLLSLATCDSGNTGTTLVPGGSIAHALHAAGIPWIVASQFPLWMKASSIATEILYTGLLNGEDPRWLLYNLRQHLRTDCDNTHDWASIVAYASVPWDFEKQVHAFNDKQIRSKIEIMFDEVEKKSELLHNEQLLTDITQQSVIEELNSLYLRIRDELQLWQDSLPKDAPTKEWAERFGMRGASEKRIGIMYFQQKNTRKANEAYQNSCDFYKQALNVEPSNHWVITQYLSVRAVLVKKSDEVENLVKDMQNWWIAVKQITNWQYSNASDEDKTWILSTQAELELLSATYSSQYKRTTARKEIKRLCKQLVIATGSNSFPIYSTRRQFTRYKEYWADGEQEYRKEWGLLAKVALSALSENRGS